MGSVSPAQVQILALMLFALGAAGILLRRSVLVVLMSIELMLNAVSLSLVGFSRLHADHGGQVFALLIGVVAVVEVAVGLALLVGLAQARRGASVDDFSSMRW